MRKKKISFTTRYVLAFGLLMLFANTLLGIFLLYQSTLYIVSLIDKNMLDVVNTAAEILDGDALAALTEDDVGGEVFTDIENKLLAFQVHSDIVFIYTVKQVSDGKYVFVVDPDPEDPADFGEEIVITEALVSAGNGIPAVDTHPEEDRWGNFYSAFSPIFDSKGNVAAIVGIDFDADQYEALVMKQTVFGVIITVATVLISGVVVFVITYSVKKRFAEVDSELSKLSQNVDRMMVEAGAESEGIETEKKGSAVDEIENLAEKIRSLQNNMVIYGRLREDQYYKDALTGIPNLNYMKQFSDEAINNLWASQKTPAVIYFDVRSMVSYNTEYGYSRGDELLKLTANTIHRAFPNGLTCRGEGDHFIVIDEYSDDLGLKADRINDTVKSGAYGSTNGIQCAIVKMIPGLKAVDGIQYARNTLKKIGDDLNVTHRFYSYEDDNDYWLTQHIVQHFNEALHNGWIKVYYQPIIRTGTKKIAVLEALARWVEPIKGIISPGQFIPVLSQYHLLHKLDLYMVENICREFRVREEAGLPLAPVSINFSAQDFDYVDVPEVLNRTLESYGVPRDRIIVEITEQDLAKATDHFKSQLQKLHESGYKLWLDDFGSAYSSINVFSMYHVDRIKFDMNLVKHLDDNNGANRIIMSSMVDMCRRMNVHTLAEGIETEDQYEFLRTIDCELVQGFYFFKPEPAEEAIAKINSTGNRIPHETPEERDELSKAWLLRGNKN